MYSRFKVKCWVLLIALTLQACSANKAKEEQASNELGPYERLEQNESEQQPLVVGPDDYNDPIEPVNRAFFYFNDKLYRFIVTPVSKGYLAVMPDPAETCITNAFKNLREPLYSANFLLQGQFKKAGKSLLRLCLNSTVGLLGLFDPADAWFGLSRETTTFGQTLANYGVGYGAYFVIPILGPSTLRDTATMTFEYYAHPIKHIMDKPESTNTLIYEGFHELTPTLKDYVDVVNEAEDPYIFIRNLYLQRKMRDDIYVLGRDELYDTEAVKEADDGP